MFAMAHSDFEKIPSSLRLCCEKILWHGRNAYAIENGLIRLVTLTGGGHVAELRFVDGKGPPTLNPLWVPPWQTIEPYTYDAKIHASRYGTINEGKLLSGLVGHNLCLDYFGSPSPEEARRGLSQHGEAASACWTEIGRRVTRQSAALTLGVRLPVAGLRFSRQITLRSGESVVYFTETVVNERNCDHFFHWVQHVTLGPHFVARDHCSVAIPATRGLTFPYGYDEGKALLSSNQEFRWPQAPKGGGGSADRRRTLLRRGLGFVVSVLIDPRRELGFVAALNNRHHVLIGYCFRRSDFPWVAVWEENRAIAAAPWKRQTEARGLEFGSTPLPLLRRESFARGPLFGAPTLAWVPARGRKTVRYLAFLSTVPRHLIRVEDIQIRKRDIIVLEEERTTKHLCLRCIWPMTRRPLR